MKKYITLAIGCLVAVVFCSFNAHRVDEEEKPTGIAYYRFSHIKDSTQSARIWTEEFMLAFNATHAVYASHTKLLQDSVNAELMRQAEESDAEEINMGTFMPVTPEILYSSPAKVWQVKEFNGSSYLLDENTGQVKWKITDETRSILGYNCQQATGMWKGRLYTAWFTTDIAAGFGPWKLRDLLGLILEAHDQSGRITFSCTKIDLGGKLPGKLTIKLPDDITRTTAAQYDKMEKAYGENLDADTFDPLSVVMMMNNNLEKTGGTQKKFTVNFPLELTK